MYAVYPSQIPEVQLIFAPAADKNHRTPLDKHKTLHFCPPQARKNTLLRASLRGFTFKIPICRCTKIYVSKLNLP